MKPIEAMFLAMDLGADDKEAECVMTKDVELWEKFCETYGDDKKLLRDADELVSAQVDKDLCLLDKNYMAGFRFGVLFGLDLLEYSKEK